MNASTADGFAGLLQWSDPIIFDRMLEAYGAQTSDLKIVWRLARLHARVWRAMIEGDFRAVDNRRNAEADARTLRELLTVVVDRFHRMPRVSMSYHLALLELAGRLTPVKPALAMAA
jgi:hypothetical protein